MNKAEGTYSDTVNVIFSDKLEDVAQALTGFPAVFVVADRKVRSFITEPLVDALAEKGVALRGVLNIRTSERRKTLRTVEKIHKWLIGAGSDRDALILAVGGGITTDLAGFAAATFKRGVKYANVPTTLLAQVDASIGGKTGCNIGGYKNMCGAFQHPEFTFVCPPLVQTLSWDLLTAGYAELLKTFIIGDASAYHQAVNEEGFDNLGALIRRAVEIKKGIVERDFKESGERRLLNLGHTFAHAIETKSRGRISHGHAVSTGIIMAAELSEKQGVAQTGLAKGLRSDFERIGLPTSCKWTAAALADIIKTDKKAEDGAVNYVLIREIGSCETRRI